MSITVYGASDDTIQVDGDIVEEFYALEDPGDGHLLAVSDGTILRVTWTDAGVWRISPVVHGTADLSIVQAPEGDEDNYTDRATLDGDVAWVVHGDEWAARKGGSAR